MTFIKRKGRATLSVGKRGPRMSYRLGCAVPILTTLLVAALLAGCGADAASTGGEDTDWVATYGGSSEVYDDIAGETDCDALQETFDRAADNNDGAEPGTDEHRWTLGYMTAADERMAAIDCY